MSLDVTGWVCRGTQGFWSDCGHSDEQGQMFSLACLPLGSAWVPWQALAPDSSFLLMHTLGGSSDGSSDRVSESDTGDLYRVSDSCFHPHPTPVITYSIWGVSQEMGNSPSPFPSSPLAVKEINEKKQDVGPGSQHLRPSLELEDWHPREQIHRHLSNSLSPQASGPFCMLLSHFPQLPKENKRCSKKSRSKASFPWDYWLHKSFPSSLGKYYKERVQIRVEHRGPTENLMDINPFYTLVDFAITDISISSCLLSNGFRACDMFQFLLKVIK